MTFLPKQIFKRPFSKKSQKKVFKLIATLNSFTGRAGSRSSAGVATTDLYGNCTMKHSGIVLLLIIYLIQTALRTTTFFWKFLNFVALRPPKNFKIRPKKGVKQSFFKKGYITITSKKGTLFRFFFNLVKISLGG